MKPNQVEGEREREVRDKVWREKEGGELRRRLNFTRRISSDRKGNRGLRLERIYWTKAVRIYVHLVLFRPFVHEKSVLIALIYDSLYRHRYFTSVVNVTQLFPIRDRKLLLIRRRRVRFPRTKESRVAVYLFSAFSTWFFAWKFLSSSS